MKIGYKFVFADKKFWNYDVIIDDETLTGKDVTGELPSWTKLGHHQCTNCPLNEGDTPSCPVAANMSHVITRIKNSLSYEEAKVVVEVEERVYYKNTDLQTGLFSLMGLIMATSKCPHFSFLRPLARFHLPFSSIQETHFRTLSGHLVKQFLKQGGEQAQCNIKDLLEQYKALAIVNRCLLERLRSYSKGDADKNAVVALNVFAQMFNSEANSNFGLLAEIFDI